MSYSFGHKKIYRQYYTELITILFYYDVNLFRDDGPYDLDSHQESEILRFTTGNPLVPNK